MYWICASVQDLKQTSRTVAKQNNIYISTITITITIIIMIILETIVPSKSFQTIAWNLHLLDLSSWFCIWRSVIANTCWFFYIFPAVLSSYHYHLWWNAWNAKQRAIFFLLSKLWLNLEITYIYIYINTLYTGTCLQFIHNRFFFIDKLWNHGWESSVPHSRRQVKDGWFLQPGTQNAKP